MMKYSKKLKSSKMEKSGALSNITCYHMNSEFNNVERLANILNYFFLGSVMELEFDELHQL